MEFAGGAGGCHEDDRLGAGWPDGRTAVYLGYNQLTIVSFTVSLFVTLSYYISVLHQSLVLWF